MQLAARRARLGSSGLGPGHTKDFFGVLDSWPRRAEYSPVSMTSAEDARFSALRFHPASEWMTAAEEFPPRFMACDVIFEKFQKELLGSGVPDSSSSHNSSKRNWSNAKCSKPGFSNAYCSSRQQLECLLIDTQTFTTARN